MLIISLVIPNAEANTARRILECVYLFVFAASNIPSIVVSVEIAALTRFSSPSDIYAVFSSIQSIFERNKERAESSYFVLSITVPLSIADI